MIHQKEKSVSSWELNYKEGWVMNWCFWTVVMEKTLENSLNCKEIKSIHPKGNQSWIFIGRTDVEAEIPILWATWWEEPIQRRPWCWERLKARGEGMTEDEMVGWHHWLNGHEFEQAPGDGEGLGSLACCSSWGLNESDMTATAQQEKLGVGCRFIRDHVSFLPSCMVSSSVARGGWYLTERAFFLTIVGFRQSWSSCCIQTDSESSQPMWNAFMLYFGHSEPWQWTRRNWTHHQPRTHCRLLNVAAK